MTQDRWLNADEQKAWRRFIRVSHEVGAQIDRQLQRDVGMPEAYYGVLVALSEAPERQMRMTDLAANLHFSTSRLTHAVNAMAEQGWVERRRCPNDGRGQFAVLTPAGQGALEQAAPGHVAEVRRLLFDRLTPDELATFNTVLRKISAALDSESNQVEVPT